MGSVRCKPDEVLLGTKARCTPVELPESVLNTGRYCIGMVPVEGSIRCLWTTYGEIVARVDEEPDSRGSLRNICRGSFTARSPEASNLIDAGIPVSDGCIGISFVTLGELGQLASWDKICTFRSGAKRSSLTTLSDTSATQALNPARYFSSKCGSDEANTVWKKRATTVNFRRKLKPT